MTYDIETVKRLIPEAMNIRDDEPGHFRFDLNGLTYYTQEMTVELLLDTRLQLELAREGLAQLTADNSERRHPNRGDLVAIARDTLAKIDEVSHG